MRFEYNVGDLLTSDEEVIGHGCNTKGAYGAGIAGQIAKRFPVARSAYMQNLPDFHLGSVQAVGCIDSRLGYDNAKVVFNMATQRRPGPDATLQAVTLAFWNLGEACYDMDFSRVGIPRIGCGIGGLTWDKVETAIAWAISKSSNYGMTIAVYDLP